MYSPVGLLLLCFVLTILPMDVIHELAFILDFSVSSCFVCNIVLFLNLIFGQ